jgi:hypothetical protein
VTAPRATLSVLTTGRASANVPHVSPHLKATKRRRPADPYKLAPPQHPADRVGVRALIFAIAALERTPPGEMSLRDYLMTRRELHIRLGRELGPVDGGWFSANAPTRLDVHVSRNLRDRVVKLLPRKDPAELDLIVERALGAGMTIVEREERRRRAWLRRARARSQRTRDADPRGPHRRTTSRTRRGRP